MRHLRPIKFWNWSAEYRTELKGMESNGEYFKELLAQVII